MGFALFMPLTQAINNYQRHARATGLAPVDIDRGLSTRAKGGTWSLSDGYTVIAQVSPDGAVTIRERRKLRRE